MFIVGRVSRIIEELEKFRVLHKREPDRMFIDLCSPPSLFPPKNGQYKECKNGVRWQGKDTYCWLKFEMIIPDVFEGKTLLAEFSTGHTDDWNVANPQLKIFRNDELIQGMDVNHRELILCEHAKKGERLEFTACIYSGMDEITCRFDLQYGQFEALVDKVIYDLRVPIDIMVEMEDSDSRKSKLASILEQAVNLLDFRESKKLGKSFWESLQAASAYLDQFLYNQTSHTQSVFGVGHTHIDVAWLWTLRQTREKAARSFTTVLRLMEQYPQFRFLSSQPQLYEYVKEDYPAVFEQIKQRVKEGRWEAEGSMWLEADCNLTSGESLIRQIYYGKQFFRKEFETECRVLWLPDAFGFSASLPQILAKSGIQYFVTAKISWNEYNRMPYDLFQWKGIDGSGVLAYFMTSVLPKEDLQGLREGFPIGTYNGFLQPDVVRKTYDRFQQKELCDTVLLPYGYGDGGGGATVSMIEYGNRMEKGLPGCPGFRFASLSDFLDVLDAAQLNHELPRWDGELYLEYHRGTYTSRAKTKKYNRLAELLLSRTEFQEALADTLFGDFHLDSAKLQESWKTVLRNQFHDILPGSAIKEVYEDSDKEYENVFETLGALKKTAVCYVSEKVNCSAPSLLVFNPTGCTCPQIADVNLPAWCECIINGEGRKIPLQRLKTGNALVHLENLPSFGYRTYPLSADKPCEETGVVITTDTIETQFFKLNFDKNAVITSIYDKKEQREVLKQGGMGNRLLVFEDMPHNFDAWDIAEYYRQKQWEITEVQSLEITERGPHRWTLQVTRQYMDSYIVQKIHVYQALPYIEFETDINWQEDQTLLKAAFDVDIHSDHAAYDIQFGHIQRPTHYNTSWDAAKFEVCAHKWADLSEYGYGAAILNDCKYGYDIHYGEMRLTLLKSATYPYEAADKGCHHFRYAFYPHAGDWREAQVLPFSSTMNQPVETMIVDKQNGSLPECFSTVRATTENIIIETVKKAEGKAGIIVRFYEAFNRHCTAKLILGQNIEAANECDLMENITGDVWFQDNLLQVDVTPFEIKTIYILFKQQ